MLGAFGAALGYPKKYYKNLILIAPRAQSSKKGKQSRKYIKRGTSF